MIKSKFSVNEIADSLSRLQNEGEVVLRGTIAANAAHWCDLVARASALIDRVHEEHREQRGLDLIRLRTELSIESDQLFAAVLSELTTKGFARAENNIARESHRPSLPPEILPAAEKIRAALTEKPFDPPSRKDFLVATASPSSVEQHRHLHQALQFLIEQGEIIELNDEITLLSESAEQMRSAVSKFISVYGPATASQLRQAVGTSRRIVIPFLEYLDRIGVTQRIGDLRQLREMKSAAVARR